LKTTSRVTLSNYLAAIGVALLILATVSPADWYPPVQLFTGLGFIAVSHVLTPCQDQLTKWWNAHVSRLWRGRQ
jgi:hypothetical protein